MSNSYFQFKQFTIHQDKCAMKVTTDGCLFGAWVAERIKDEKAINTNNCLDIGTGTGLLSLMLAQKFPAMQFDAIEINKEAAQQAEENVTASPWKEKISVIYGDVKDKAFATGRLYDVIISNPPFYENELVSPDEKKNIAHHNGGLLLEEIAEIISSVLTPEGRFYLLLPYKRMTEAGLLIEKYQLTITHSTLVSPSTQHGYFRLFVAGKQKGNTNESYSKDEIAVKDSNGEYTTAFISLLKDYYLHL